MKKGVTKGRSDEDEAKTTIFALETGSKLFRVGYGNCQAHKKIYKEIYYRMLLRMFKIKPFSRGVFID